MNFLILSLVIYGVAATPIGSSSNNQRIVRGSEASPGQFPYLALIRHSEYLHELCAGSIISSQWILTSAMCIDVFEFTSNTVKVVVGSIYLNSGGTTHSVLLLHKHEDYVEESAKNNIGLILVRGQISYNDFVQPIGLYTGSTSAGLQLTIAGWGETNWFPEIVLPNTLQYYTFKSMSLDECKTVFPISLVPLSDSQLCTYSSTIFTSLCDRDQGSPVVYNGVQHGVVSMPSSCKYRVPDIHTRVAPFRSWIKEIANV